MAKKQIIYLWLDFASPYSYIGFMNLRKAITDSRRKDLILDLKSFQIDPELDVFDATWVKEIEKIIRNERRLFETDEMATFAKNSGVKLNFKGVGAINTVHPHRLLQLAKTYGENYETANDLARLLFLNWWTKSRNISVLEELIKIASGVGIDEKAVRSVFDSDKYLDLIFLDEEEGHDVKIQGIPYAVFPNHEAITGSASVEQYKKIIKNISVIEDDKERGK